LLESFSFALISKRIVSVAATQIIINEAVSFWQSNTCLKFALNGAGTNSIQFFKGDGCYSYIGMQGGQQKISLGDGCEYVSKTNNFCERWKLSKP
jgi:hypothetical protein